MADSWEDDDSEPVLNLAPAVAKAAVVTPVVLPPPAADDSDDGGNWDDDDFEAPVLPAANVVANSEEEDEDLVYNELNKKETSKGAPSKAAQAQARKNAAEEEAILNQVRNAGLKGETAEQKRLRERKQQEESDMAQAIDAFDGFTVKTEKKETMTHDVFVTLTKGIGSVILKTKQDHTNFGVNTHIKLLNSKASHIAAFYCALSEILRSNSFTLAILGPIIDDIKKAKDIVEQRERATGIVHVAKQVNNVGTGKATVAVDADDDGDIWGDDEIIPSKPVAKKVVDGDELLKEEHGKYGSALNLKLSRSTPQNITAFYKAFSAILEKVQWSSVDLDEVYNCYHNIYAAREKVEAKIPKVKSAKDTKKEKEEEQKRLKSIFGDSDYVDDYSDYTRMEDDYM